MKPTKVDRELAILRGQCLRLAFDQLQKEGKINPKEVVSLGKEYFIECLKQGLLNWDTDLMEVEDEQDNSNYPKPGKKPGHKIWLQEGKEVELSEKWKVCSKCDKIVPSNPQEDQHKCVGEDKNG